jgi:UDP-N-acetylglucosamine:LPS N-acetylglucosamine transferase
MSEHRPTSKPKILVTLTGGGFLWEAKSLIKGLGDQFEFHYVTTPDAAGADRSDLPDGELHQVSHVTVMSQRTALKICRNLLASFGDARRVLRQVRPDAVVCVGSSIAVPLCLWARIMGVKAVFVESITRVSEPSKTGRILSALRLCDRIYVQWPEAEQLYARAFYRGTVL